MKNSIFIIALLAIFAVSCTTQQNQLSKTSLSANEFDGKIKELPNAPIIDVRTPDEFSKGHLANAKNIDWNGNDFENQIASLDKSKPVLVYCLSGGRSSAAANQMRSEGFKEVYELEGGLMKWRSANLPETTDNTTASTGMTKEQFDALMVSDKIVLVDFYADWCKPCQMMKPYLEEIATEMKDKVVLVRINADDNSELCKEMKIDALPVLQVYKNKTLSWNNVGYVEKGDVVKQLQ